MTSLYFFVGFLVGVLATMVFWVYSERKLKFVHEFTFTENQRYMVKEIINQYYTPENCDICNRYKEVHNDTVIDPPFKNCAARKDTKALKEARETNELMFKEMEKVIQTEE